MEPNKISDVFFSFENPAIYAIAFTVIIIVLVFLIKREFIKPLLNKKKKLELENTKLTALYAEVDPDPILRTDIAGKVIDMNNSAREVFKDKDIQNANINTLIQNIDIIDDGNDINHEIKIADKYYTFIMKEIEELGYKHIYLHDITSRVEYEKKIKDYQDNLKELRMRVDLANEKEKQLIGKELHDSVGNSLSLLKIEMQNYFYKNDINVNESEANKMLHSVDVLSEEVREISHQLRPRILSEFGLVQALMALVDKINLQGKMQGYVNQNNELEVKDKNLEQNIYRICQEALSNIIKHSECTEFNVDIFVLENSLKIMISDDGKGFNIEEQFNYGNSSLGLLNMKERAAAIGGSFTVDSIENMGTTIYLNVDILGV